MSTDQPKPYTTLPEPFVLLTAAVWIDLLAAAWTLVTPASFVAHAAAYAGLLVVAAAHSWFFARRALWSNATHLVAVTAAWLVMAAGACAFVESYSGNSLFGLLAFLQIVLCSFLFNHATFRIAHILAFGAMLAASTRLQLAVGGALWLVFALASMLVLAYNRTAVKAGPAGYDRGEARRTAQRLTLVSCVALLTALLFLVMPLLRWPEMLRLPALPRTGSGAEAPRPQPHGDHPFGIDGSTGIDRANADIDVMLVSTDQKVSGPLYLRGQAFDTFDGVNWSRSEADEREIPVDGAASIGLPFRPPTAMAVKSEELTQTYTMRVNMREVLFTACRPTAVQFPGGWADSLHCSVGDHSLRVDSDIPAGMSYRVYGRQEAFSDASLMTVSYAGPREYSPRDLAIPSGIDPAVHDIAARETSSYATPYQKALALERYLHGKDFYYSLDHDVHGPQVVNDFLLRAKRGHCAIYASTMVVMARSINLPARYVTGFLAQDRRSDGFHVRGSDAHAWVEVYVAGAGWIAFDPTASRIAPDDATTRNGASRGGRPDARTDDKVERGGGLYGRDGRDFESGGGTPGRDGSGGSDGPGGAGGSGDDVARNDSGGRETPGGAGDPAGTHGGSTGGTNGGTNGSASGTDASSGGSRGSGSDRAGATSDPNRTVIPPGGSTRLPQRGRERITGGAETPSSGTSTPIARKPEPPPSPEQVASEWRLLVAVLVIAGLAGLVLLLVWQQGIRRVAERRQIREALPLGIDDDPDPRRFVVKLYHTMVAGLGRVGYPKRDSETPGEFATAVAQRKHKLAEPVGELTELFHAARYGEQPVTPEEAAAARSLWRRIATSVKRVEQPAVSEES